jgi:hypothetical protein
MWPAQFMGFATWLDSLPPEVMPTAVIEFATTAAVGIRKQADNQLIGFPDPSVESRPLLYHFAGHKMAKMTGLRLHLATLNTASSAIYSAVVGHPVHVLPWPIVSRVQRSRTGKRPLTISILGAQRPGKGYRLVPEIAESLLRDHTGIRLLIHNASPHRMPEIQQRLRDLAGRNERLELNKHNVTPDGCCRLLDSSDLIVCPYDPAPYLSAHSGIVAEALGNGIPVVVPAGTILESMLEEHGYPGAAFDTLSTESVGSAVTSAIHRYDALLHAAQAAAMKWRQTHGPSHIVDKVLDLAQLGK